MTASTISLVSSLVLMSVFLIVKQREISTGKTTFLTRLSKYSDQKIADKTILAREKAVLWFHQASIVFVHLLTRGVAQIHSFLRGRLKKVRADFLEAIREKRSFSPERDGVSLFLRDVFEHKARFRGER